MVKAEKTNVLIVDNSFDMTGAFKSISGLTKSINTEFEFYFAVPKKSKLASRLRNENIQCIEIPFLEIGRNWKIIFYLPMLLMNNWQLLRYIRKHQIQIVHVNDLYNMTGIVLKNLNRNLKLVYHVRLLPGSYVGRLYSYWLRLINKWADYCMVVSSAVKESVKEVVHTPIRVIYDFVPLEDGGEQHKEANEFVDFVYPANYSKGKGQEFALQAFAEVYKEHRNISLTFYGSDAGSEKNILFKKELVSLCSKLGLANHVSFNQSTSNIEKVMKEADVVLMFSESESFSMVSYEALYYGRPIIATDCGGPAELIEHNQTGLLIPNRSVKSMIDSMNVLITNPELRHKLAENAYAAIRAKIANHDAKSRLADVYRQILL